MSSSPYLSFVLASRNDDHAGGMLRRLQACVDNLLEQIHEYEIPAELVVVDWNPIAERPVLKDALSWPSESKFCSVRVIEVPSQVHYQLRFAQDIPFLVHTAWNVGIRRSRGKFVLSMSNDLILSNELMQFFSKQILDSSSIYRIDRYDIPEQTLELTTLTDRLRFAEDNVKHIHNLDGAMRIPGHSVRIHTNAAGDFLLMAKRFWDRLKGLPQERDFHSAKLDGILCCMANAAGATQQILPDPMRAYHVSHGVSDWETVDGTIGNTVRNIGLAKYLVPLVVRKFVKRTLLRPKSQVVKWGLPQMTKSQYKVMATEILDRKRPFTYNETDWGLHEACLQESVVLERSWQSNDELSIK